MKLWKSSQGTLVLQVLSGRSNVYLIGNNTYILVDTGKRNAFGALLKNLHALGLNPSDLRFLILTHSHFDHCQNTAQLLKEAGFSIVASAKAIEKTENGFSPLPAGTNPFSGRISRMGNRIGAKRFGFTPFTPSVLVKESMILLENNPKIELISTPGHSSDSISVLVDDEIALVGDTLFGIFPNSAFPPFADDVSALMNSWKTLLHTQCSIFLPGHGKSISRTLLTTEIEKRTL